MSNGLPRRPARFTDVRRLFVIAGALAVAAGLANVLLFDWTSQATAGKPFDFDLNWVAAQRLVDREPLYDRKESLADGLELVGPEMQETNKGPFSSFIGLPSTALAYVPFTPFDVQTAADLFRLVDIIAMIAALGITLLALPPPSRLPAGLIAGGALLLATSVNKSIWLGQVDGFLMLGLALAFFGVTRDRWRLVGFGIAIAALLKFSPVLLLVYLALRGKWRAVWAAVLTVVGVLGVAALIGRPADLVDWFSNVADSVSQGARISDNQSLPAAFARVFTGSNDIFSQVPLGGWRFMSYAIAVIGVGGWWWLRRSHPIEPLDLGILVLVALLTGPVSWDHYTSWSLLVLALIVDPRRWAGRSWLEIMFLVAPLGLSVLLMRTWTTYNFPDQVAAHWYLRVTSSPKTAAVLLMLAVAVWLMLRPVREPSDAPVPLEEPTPLLADG